MVVLWSRWTVRRTLLVFMALVRGPAWLLLAAAVAPACDPVSEAQPAQRERGKVVDVSYYKVSWSSTLV